MTRPRLWSSLALVSTVGCGSGSAGSSATCTPDSARLDGTLEGAAISGSYASLSSYVFDAAAKNQPGTVLVSFGTGGKLSLTWTEVVADGQGTAAYGSLALPTDGPLPGESFCISAATVTVLPASQGGGISFELSTLVEGPCAGVSVAGTLAGCASPAAK